MQSGVHPKGVQSSTPTTSHLVFTELALCTGALSCNIFRASLVRLKANRNATARKDIPLHKLSIDNLKKGNQHMDGDGRVRI